MEFSDISLWLETDLGKILTLYPMHNSNSIGTFSPFMEIGYSVEQWNWTDPLQRFLSDPIQIFSSTFIRFLLVTFLLSRIQLRCFSALEMQLSIATPLLPLFSCPSCALSSRRQSWSALFVIHIVNFAFSYSIFKITYAEGSINFLFRSDCCCSIINFSEFTLLDWAFFEYENFCF